LVFRWRIQDRLLEAVGRLLTAHQARVSGSASAKGAEPDGPRHVLAMLNGSEQEMLSVLEAAIELAHVPCAKLTLLVSTDPGLAARWFGRLAEISAGLEPLDDEFEQWIAKVVPAMTRRVPEAVAVATVITTGRPGAVLSKLAGQGYDDVMVIRAKPRCGHWHLRRQARRLGIAIHEASVSWTSPVTLVIGGVPSGGLSVEVSR
jgi:hypothetical protein